MCCEEKAVQTVQTLITGFGPFGAVLDNPSQRLVDHFAVHPVPGHELTTQVLPVSFRRAPQEMIEALEHGDANGRPFDLVLMLGVAANAPTWRVERYGRNRDASIRDVDGYLPAAASIVAEAPMLLPVTVPGEAVTTAIQRVGLPVIASEDAGGYLCNHILFRTLHFLAMTGSRTRALFLHVPSDETTGGAGAVCFPFAQQVIAVEAVLQALLAPEI